MFYLILQFVTCGGVPLKEVHMFIYTYFHVSTYMLGQCVCYYKYACIFYGLCLIYAMKCIHPTEPLSYTITPPPVQVSIESMQSRLVPGLFLAGELLDIDGVTGGYNFQVCVCIYMCRYTYMYMCIQFILNVCSCNVMYGQ